MYVEFTGVGSLWAEIAFTDNSLKGMTIKECRGGRFYISLGGEVEFVQNEERFTVKVKRVADLNIFDVQPDRLSNGLKVKPFSFSIPSHYDVADLENGKGPLEQLCVVEPALTIGFFEHLISELLKDFGCGESRSLGLPRRVFLEGQMFKNVRGDCYGMEYYYPTLCTDGSQ